MTSPALSVQLYSVNTAYTADPDGTLAKLAEIGLKNVEAFNFVGRGAELAAEFDRHGLVARTGHAPFLSDELRFGDRVMPVPALDDVFTAAKQLGLKYLIDPFIPLDRWLDADQITATAQRLNKVADQAAEHGLKVGYHNHSQEFAATIDGISGYEFFAQQLADDVALEVDLYWAATGTDDLLGLLERLGSKVKALHVKDGIIGADPFGVDAAPWDPTSVDQRSAGQGEVPLLEALAAAPSTEFAVIEFDHYKHGDIFDGIKGSVEFFNSHGIR